VTDPNRKAFEDAVFAHYARIKAAGWSAPEEGSFTPEALFWHQPNGQYGVHSVEHAWWGWQLRGAQLRAASAQSIYLMLSEDALKRTSFENVADVMNALLAHATGG
jgi:hypothetical protein